MEHLRSCAGDGEEQQQEQLPIHCLLMWMQQMLWTRWASQWMT